MAVSIASYSELMDWVEKGRIVEAQEKIIELRASWLSLQEENFTLQEQNLILQKKIGKLEQTLLATQDTKEQTSSHSLDSLKPFGEMRNAFEKNYLISILTVCEGNVTHAARLAGKHRADFYDLLRKHQLNARDFKKTTWSVDKLRLQGWPSNHK